MAREEIPSAIDQLLQTCLVKLEKTVVFTCELCDTVYSEKDSLTRHLAGHVKDEDTVIHTESSRYEQKHSGSTTCKTSCKKVSENSVKNFKTQHKPSIRDRIRFESESDDDDIIPKTETCDDNITFVSEQSLSGSDYQLFFDCSDMLATNETLANASRDIEDTQNTLDINKENESTSNSVSAIHILNKSYGKLIPCRTCNKHFAHESSLKIHELTHKKVIITREGQGKQTRKAELYACNQCQKEFPKKKYLTQHRQTHIQKSWECSYCGKEFNIKIQMQRHQRVHTDEKPYMCKICNVSFRNYSSYSLHTRNVHTKERPMCGICDRQFSQKTALLRHILSIHMTTGYPCSRCNKEFGHPMARARHMVIHKKTFKCSCGKCFRVKSDLERHEMLHKKPFECHNCNMKFGKKYHLERHIKNSCKKGPKLQRKLFECNVCHMKTQRKDALKVHLKICKLKPYNCKKCRLRFVDRSSLTSHLSRHRN